MSQYLGGSGQETATSIGHDQQGFLYVAGTTTSSDFPLAGNSEQTALAGGSNIFLVKIDPNASPANQIVYATYLGGTNVDTLSAMVVTPRDFIYLTGNTTSIDFPLGNAAQGTLSGTSDAFVVMLDCTVPGTSSIYYSTYYGGSDDTTGNDITYDAQGRPFIVGTTDSPDLTIGAGFQSSYINNGDVFVAGFDPSQQGAATLFYGTYLGGTEADYGRSIQYAPDGTLWVAGLTFSQDFPTAGNAWQGSYIGMGDAFVSQINPGAGTNGLLYSTFFGGTGQDEAKKLILDSAGRIILTGYTDSQDFPVTPNALQYYYGGNTDAFVAILDPSISGSAQLVYATYYGGSAAEVGYDMIEDAAGNLFLTGYTSSPDLPLTASALESTYSTGFDGFVLELNPALSAMDQMEYASYIAGPGNQAGNGIDLGPNETVYIVGYATGEIFNPIGGAPRVKQPGLSAGFVYGFSACTFSTSVQSFEFPTGGGSFTVNVTTGSGCSWTAFSNLNWVSVSPSGGMGPGAVTITAPPNTTGTRLLDYINIAGIQFLVGQNQ